MSGNGSAFDVPAPDEALLDQVASQMDLRTPNRDAIEVLALRMNQWYERPREEFFEGVIDSATGVGKTFIIAGAIDYYAALGVRNFAIIVPGATILNKTVAQFTHGPKSLLGVMATKPKVITSENFRTSDVASALADDSLVKLYVFTVQALLKPTNSQVGRRTHKFQEGLGGAFYDHLDALEDLIVFADEHHTYFGKAFSKAVRDLTPLALVGLTGTPHKQTAEDDIIFRYPLTAAIAEQYVKTPVLVGRKDDRTDERTQLLDAVQLLETKEKALKTFCEKAQRAFVHPILLVNCRDIEHAKEVVGYVTSDQFFEGRYSGDGVVLEVHSNQSDKALEDLDRVEEAGSLCRIIVQVGMLKEGWDVKNVYVIASLRASVSDILTEQTLGRGLRLPFGGYVDMPLLNELDVIAHERYEDLLKRTGALKESFIDKRTVIERFVNADGEEEVGVTTTTVELGVEDEDAVSSDHGASSGTVFVGGTSSHGGGSLSIGSVEERLKNAAKAAAAQPMDRLATAPTIMVPTVRTTPIPQPFSLVKVTELAAFRDLGRRLAVEPEEYLRRTKLGGTVKTTDGQRVAAVTTDAALQRVSATRVVDDLDAAKQSVIAAVMNDRLVMGRKGEPGQAMRLLNAVIEGAGTEAPVVLSSYRSALVAGMLREIRRAKDKLPRATQDAEVVAEEEFAPVRYERQADKVSGDRKGKYERGFAYTGWIRSLFPQVWFDSGTERDGANILDDADEIAVWVRLHRDDLPILWDGAGKTYNPDFLAVDKDGRHWVIETKSDKDLPTDDVQNKRAAAIEWANTVSAETGTPWGYLLVAERDLKDASGSWSRLRAATQS